MKPTSFDDLRAALGAGHLRGRNGQVAADERSEPAPALDAADDRGEADEASPGTRCHVVKTMRQVRALFAFAREYGELSIDFETTSKKPHDGRAISLQVSVEEGESFFINFTHPQAPQLPTSEVLSALAEAMADTKVVTIAANIKFEWQWLMKHGVTEIANPWDVLIAAHLLDGSRKIDLKNLAAEDLDVKMKTYKQVVKGRASLEEVPFDEVLPYGCADSDAAMRLFHMYGRRIDKRHRAQFYKVEMPLTRVLAKVELVGVSIDRSHLERLRDVYGQQRRDAAARINALSAAEGWPVLDTAKNKSVKRLVAELGMALNINLNAEGQIKRLVQSTGVRLSKKTKDGGVSLDKEVLEELTVDCADRCDCLLCSVRDYRLATQLQRTHITGILDAQSAVTGRVHPSFNQFNARSFRLSCSEPNLQNVPKADGKAIRHGFMPAPGHVFVRADLNQIELRVVAHLADVSKMREIFERGEDLHKETALKCFGTVDRRDEAKVINFGLIYGMTEFGLAQRRRISRREAERMLSKYAKVYPEVPRFQRRCQRSAVEDGYVETILGARRYFRPEDRRRFGWERAAFNHPVQGSAGDLFKFAMIRVHKAIAEYEARIVLTIHDELVIEAPVEHARDVARVVQEIMEEGLEPLGVELDVPLKVECELQDRWGRRVESTGTTVAGRASRRAANKGEL